MTRPRRRLTLASIAGAIAHALRVGGRSPDAAPPIRTDSCGSDHLVANLGDVLVHLDLAGRLLFVSPSCRGLLGIEPEALVGTRLEDALHPDEAGAVSDLMASVVRGEHGSALIVHRQRRGDGAWAWVETCWRVIPDADGRPAGFVGSIRDASARREAETVLQGGQLPYKALADTLPQLVWMERADTGETIYANRAFERYFGAIGTGRAGRVACFHPDDAQVIAGCEAGTEGPQTCDVQGRLRRGDGTYHWHHLVFSPLRKGGDLLGWLVSALDVDEIVAARRALQETKDLLRLSQEAAGAGLFDLNLSSREAILSPESAGLHGLPGDRPAVIGLRDWMRRVQPEDRMPAVRAVRTAMTERRTFDIEFRVRFADGGTRWTQAIGRPCRDASGGLSRIVGLNLDVSQRKEAEAALVEAKGAAEAARRAAEGASVAKTDFLSAMSHEIRTPLNAVIGFAGLLAASDRLEGDLRRYAELARTSGEALLTVVNDILDFSSVEAGALTLQPEAFAIGDLVDGCLTIVDGAARAKSIATQSLIDAALPRRLVGDRARLRQVLLNLLNNAIKFTASGSVTLSLRHEGRTPWGERIRFSVTDTGIGIAGDKHHRLFQNFSQVDGSIRRDYGGTGLGLAICKRIVDLMGGEIGVASEPGRGSTFWFTLTLPRAASEGGPVPTGGDRPAGRHGRVLLVEDIAINQELASLMLTAMGHTVEVAGDGFAAVRAVTEGAYDIVLMDVQMPGMDGIMATRLIRCLPGAAARIPIVAMTANVLPDEVRAFREAGMDDHLGKPFVPADLQATIARWLPASPTAAPVPTEVQTLTPDGGPEPTIDRTRYEDSLALLPPAAVARLLDHLGRLVTGGFADPAETSADRARLRAEAHALASISGLLGFLALGAACAALDGFSEERITQEGRAGFDIALARARALAAAAAFETRRMTAQMRDDAPAAAAVR